MERSSKIGVWLAVAAMAGVGCAKPRTKTDDPDPAAVSGRPTPMRAAVACDAAGNSGLVPVTPADVGSAVVLARQGERTLAFVADSDYGTVATVDVDTGTLLAQTDVGGQPSQLLMTADGRLVVALRDRSRVSILAPDKRPEVPLAPACSVQTAAEPVGLALTPDGSTLLVTSGWGAALTGLRAHDLTEKFEVDLPRDPRAVVATADGKTAYVTHAVGGRMSAVSLGKGQKVREIRVESTRAMEIERSRRSMRQHLNRQLRGKSKKERARLIQASQQNELRLRKRMRPPERTGTQGFALARSIDPAGRIYGPSVLTDSGEPGRRTPGYGEEHNLTQLPAVAVLDERTGEPLEASLTVPSPWRLRADERTREPCLLPRAVAVDSETQSLLVGCHGIDAVVAYDAHSANPARAEKRRWHVASGPVGIAVDADQRRAVVWSQFDRTLSTISLTEPDLAAEERRLEPIAEVRLPTDSKRELPVKLALGRLLFHASGDTRIAKDGRSCASCHPDGRDDGLVWSTPNGPRRTIMLAGKVMETAPYTWNGETENLKSHLHETFDRLRGSGGLRSLEMRALVSYVESLEPPVDPRAGANENLVARGRKIFDSEEAGCAECHPGASSTDNKAHDIGSGAAADSTKAFNTPSLRFISKRGPFFHDGRYETLGELLAAIDGKMGKVKHLDSDELAALEAYLAAL